MDAVERHVTLPADLEEVWELLTCPEDQAGWLGAEVDLDPIEGRDGLVVDHDGTRRRLVVDRVDPGRSLAWHWWVDGDDEGDDPVRSAVEVTLRPTLDGTLVTVTEQPLAPLAGSASASASVHAMTSSAWSHRLLHLEALLLVALVRG